MALFTGAEDGSKIVAIIGNVVTAEGDAAIAVEVAATSAHAVMRPNAQQEISGGVLSLMTTALESARPNEAISVKTNYMVKAARTLASDSIFRSAHVNPDEYRALVSLSDHIREHTDRRQWNPVIYGSCRAFSG